MPHILVHMHGCKDCFYQDIKGFMDNIAYFYMQYSCFLVWKKTTERKLFRKVRYFHKLSLSY